MYLQKEGKNLKRFWLTNALASDFFVGSDTSYGHTAPPNLLFFNSMEMYHNGSTF